MTKILCKTLSGALSSQTYTTPKGNVYEFHRGVHTEVKDAEDALHFLKAGNGELFETTNPIKEAIKKLSAKIKEKIDPEPSEYDAPDETGALEPSEDEILNPEGDGEEVKGDDDEDLEAEDVDDGEEKATPTAIEDASDTLKEKLDNSVEMDVPEDDAEKIPDHPTKEYLMAQTKQYIDELAENTYNIKLDRRKSKEDMIKDFHEQLGVQDNE